MQVKEEEKMESESDLSDEESSVSSANERLLSEQPMTQIQMNYTEHNSHGHEYDLICNIESLSDFSNVSQRVN